MAENFNNEAERIILGSVICHDKDMARLITAIQPEDFYRVGHRVIYEAMIELFNRGAAIDFVTIKEQLGGQLERAGGTAYVAGLVDGVPRITNIDDWCAIVRDHSTRRRLKAVALQIQQIADEGEDPQVLIDAALAEVLAVAHRANAGKGYKAPQDVAKAAMVRLDRLAQKGICGIPTGIHDFDDLTNGLNAPDLTIVAGRPGMGKTAAAITIAMNVAAQGKNVGFVSLEMGADQLGVRELSKESNVNPHRLKVDEKAWGKVAQAYTVVSKLPIFVDDEPGQTLTKIMARARQLQAEHGLDVLIIDYLQLIHGEGKSRWDRQFEIAQIARGLKDMAKMLNIPVIALAQLSRESEKRADKRPQMSDLRESGEIEQAADIIVLLYREYEYDKSKDPEAAEWILAKNRNGVGGDTIHVRYLAARTTFVNREDKVA